jgi:predicted Zn-dependent protease with MMP-like domain
VDTPADPSPPVDAGDRPATPEAVDFDAVIDDVIDDLPDAFAERLASVAIVVEEEATMDQLSSVRAHGLFGLYQGVPRTRFGVDNVPLPSKITLFRGPLIRANRTAERLTRAIEDTLLHEIAHHFGIDDARLHQLRAEGRASRISSAERGHARG